MDLEFEADPANGEPELFIHLDMDGLAALLKAIGTAMLTGLGELALEARGSGGTIVGTGSPHAFGKVTLIFDRPDRRGGTMPN